MVRSDLCDYSDAYIVVNRTITVANPENDAYDKELILKNNAPLFLAFQNLKIRLLTMQKI